jgi:1,4-dihydroxy-2-naphthoate octaprenyltransferase
MRTSDAIRALVLMSRPVILSSAVLAFALGAAMGYHERGELPAGPALLELALTLLANLAAHFADEYADADTDALARHTGVSGGSGALAAGLATPSLALGAAAATAALCLALAGWAAAAGALPAVCLWYVAAGLAGGWAYSMPPLALERRGLGELANALLGGLLIPLMGYAAVAGPPPPAAHLALAPVVAAVLANLVDVHWADRAADAAVGKRTLAVLLGPRVAWLQRAWLALAYGLPPLLAAAGVVPWPVAWATLATLPVGFWAALQLGRTRLPVGGPAAMTAIMVAQSLAYALG